MRRKFLISFGILVLLVSSLIYLEHRYFFNPLSFKKDVITPHSWIDYKHPMTLTYFNFKDGRESAKVEQEEEVRLFIEELKDCPPANATFRMGDVEGALKLSNGKDTLLEVFFYRDHGYVLRKDESNFKVTDDLKGLIDKL